MSVESFYEALAAPVQYELPFPEYKFKVGDIIKTTLSMWEPQRNASVKVTYVGVVINRRFYNGKEVAKLHELLTSKDPFDREILYYKLDKWRYRVRIEDWTSTLEEDKMTLLSKEELVSWEL